jgi:hypothetical protein
MKKSKSHTCISSTSSGWLSDFTSVAIKCDVLIKKSVTTHFNKKQRDPAFFKPFTIKYAKQQSFGLQG